jgi:hypothetical protein
LKRIAAAAELVEDLLGDWSYRWWNETEEITLPAT